MHHHHIIHSFVSHTSTRDAVEVRQTSDTTPSILVYHTKHYSKSLHPHSYALTHLKAHDCALLIDCWGRTAAKYCGLAAALGARR
jgi:hypothetical protein